MEQQDTTSNAPEVDRTLGAHKGSTVLPILRLFTLFVKAVAWPGVVLFIFLAVREPILDLLSRVPEVISGSTKITYGSFSMEIAKSAREAGTPELAGLVGGLSARAVEDLLNTSRGKSHNYTWDTTIREGSKVVAIRVTLPAGEALRAFNELEAKGLIVFTRDRGGFEHLIRQKMKQVEAKPDETRFEWTQSPSTADLQDVASQRYALTPRGERAQELILRTIGRMIGSTPDRGSKR